MSGRYAVEDLLNLRASPLVCRPPGLPPIEEWMGSQDATAKRPTTRAKVDESSSTTDTFQKRPILLDSQRRTTTDPERLVLGPPRRSFASSNARPTAKTLEGSDDVKDRSSFHDKTKNLDGSEPRPQGRRDTQTNGRYGNRNESEEPDVDSRRDYDRRPKWGARDRAEHQDLEDDQDDSRQPYRKDTHSRAKLSQSWFRKDNGEALEETKRDNDRPSDWRRDRTRDRDWDRSNKPEADPEWMDAAEPEEPFQVHTQEDFQRWKERMKAGGASADKPENASVDTSRVDLPEKPLQKIVAPEPDDSMDKFFARFEQKSTEQPPTAAKSAGKTRFASLFSPPVEQNKQVEAPSPPVVDRPSSAHRTQVSPKDADQAGFARILEMLQTRSNNPTPQNQDQPKSRTPLYARDTQARPEAEPQPPSSDLLSLLGGRPPSQHPDPSSGQPSSSDDRYNDSRSPSEQPTHTRQQSSIHKDEMLLNLLRQASLAPKPQPPPPHQQQDYRPGGGMYAMPPPPNTREDSSRSRGGPAPGQDPMMSQRRETGRSMFDESPMPMYPIEPGPREQLQRRPTNGAPRGYDDDPLIALLRGQSKHPSLPPNPPQQPPQGPPPGFQRPPGLEQMPRSNPSWPPQQPQPQQPQQQQPPLHHPSMPPGLPNLPRGMSGPPYGQPQQIPQQPNMVQQQQQRPPPQRKYTNESPSSGGLPNFPPGMGPPPGFMNAGGPPPGFPNLGPGNFPGRFPPEPPSAGGGRPYLENMYGDGAGRGIPSFRGGGGPGGGNGGGAMPGYR